MWGDFGNEIRLLCGGKSVLTKGLLEHCRAEKSTLIAEGVQVITRLFRIEIGKIYVDLVG